MGSGPVWHSQAPLQASGSDPPNAYTPVEAYLHPFTWIQAPIIVGRLVKTHNILGKSPHWLEFAAKSPILLLSNAFHEPLNPHISLWSPSWRIRWTNSATWNFFPHVIYDTKVWSWLSVVITELDFHAKITNRVPWPHCLFHSFRRYFWPQSFMNHCVL